MKGVIVYYKNKKKYGFIKAFDKNVYFFHKSGFLEKKPFINEGDYVEFVPHYTKKGCRAVDIHIEKKKNRLVS